MTRRRTRRRRRAKKEKKEEKKEESEDAPRFWLLKYTKINSPKEVKMKEEELGELCAP